MATQRAGLREARAGAGGWSQAAAGGGARDFIDSGRGRGPEGRFPDATLRRSPAAGLALFRPARPAGSAELGPRRPRARGECVGGGRGPAFTAGDRGSGKGLGWRRAGLAGKWTGVAAAAVGVRVGERPTRGGGGRRGESPRPRPGETQRETPRGPQRSGGHTLHTRGGTGREGKTRVRRAGEGRKVRERQSRGQMQSEKLEGKAKEGGNKREKQLTRQKCAGAKQSRPKAWLAENSRGRRTLLPWFHPQTAQIPARGPPRPHSPSLVRGGGPGIWQDWQRASFPSSRAPVTWWLSLGREPSRERA